MNELLAAAKAVINHWNEFGAFKVKNYIPALRAAVERAEKQEGVGFDEFLETKYPVQLLTKYDIKYLKEVWIAAQQAERTEKQEVDFVKWWERTYGGQTCKAFAEDSWKTSQQAERERIKNVIAELLDPTDPWIHYSTLLERIDGPDDNSGEG